MSERAARSFYRKKPGDLAIALLGQRLVRILPDGRRLSGLIVETEAYLGIPDKAAHTFGGRRTPRNASMWLDGGHAYVYFTYGMHHCMNIVSQREDEPTAVLLRAIEPREGLDVMRIHRGVAVRNETDLCSGPAKLCQALAINREQDGIDLIASNHLFVERVRHRRIPTDTLAVGPRIGVAYAGEWADKPLRFWIKGNPHVSRGG